MALAAVRSKAVVLLLIGTPIVRFGNRSMFCCALLCVHSSFAIILMGKREREREREREGGERERELVALLYLSSWCLVIVVWPCLTMPWVRLQFEVVVFPDHTYLLFFMSRLLCLCCVFTVKVSLCLHLMSLF